MDYWHPNFTDEELKEQSRLARRHIRKQKSKSFLLYLRDNWIAIVALIVAIITLFT